MVTLAPELRYFLVSSTCSPPRSTDGAHVYLTHFYPYLRNFLAPDHCVSGLINCMLQDVFTKLPPVQRISEVDISFFAALKLVGVTVQATLYNTNNKHVNSTPMTTLYSLILVLRAVLRSALCSASNIPGWDVIKSLQKLTALLF